MGFLCITACLTYKNLYPIPPQGVCIEKYYFPSYQTLVLIDMLHGEGLVPEDPSPKVYKIKPDIRPIPEQWICKVGWTNKLGQRTAFFVKVPKETWMKNHPGQKFQGEIFIEPPKGLNP